MIEFLKKLLGIKKKPSPFIVDVNAETIPQAFGYPEDQYRLFVDDLTAYIIPDDKLISLHNYLKNIAFEKFGLDIKNPRHAIIIGYAFCSAIFIQRDIQMHKTANKVLETFYNRKGPNTTNIN